jgi:DNA polymerase III gamma/tau subunit
LSIRSRCQRYDFRLIPQSVVAKRVREILAAETLTADDAAVQLVAREAAGSMRDALTLLDQIVAFGGLIEDAGFTFAQRKSMGRTTAKLNALLASGRRARMASIRMFFQDGFTGTAAVSARNGSRERVL